MACCRGGSVGKGGRDRREDVFELLACGDGFCGRSVGHVAVSGSVTTLPTIEKPLFSSSFGKFEKPAFVAEEAAIVEVAINPVAVALRFAPKHGEQIVTVQFEGFGWGCPRDGSEGGEDVGEVGDGAGCLAWSDSRTADDARGAGTAFGDGAFACAAGAIITDEDEVGVLLETFLSERPHKFSHEMI